MPRPDPHSYRQDDQPVVTHIDLEVRVDFGTKTLDCRAVLALIGEGTALDLDTRDLWISTICDADGKPLNFSIGEPDAVLGSRLAVTLQPGVRSVYIYYETRQNASGLQWLSAELAGSQYPFLFSQAEAIHARSFVPCQDTPGVRTTYHCWLTVPKAVRGLMAAKHLGRVEHESEAVEEWLMEQPIPSYLIALAVGELVSRELSPDTTLWTQPSLLEQAAWEFAKVDEIMAAAVKLFGPYRWNGFNLLVLPRSFPYGGMENPTLTFLTPTIVVGDRSMVDVVAHELAHAWTGNLVTNATWSDFWINEGWTTWAQFRIVEAVWGREIAELQAACLMQELGTDFNRFRSLEQPELTYLETPSDGSRDPDEAFSRVPYMKGYLFLRLLEETVGRDRFDGFVRDYIQAFAFKSITTDQFLTFFETAFPGVLHGVMVGAWIEGPYLPLNSPTMRGNLLARLIHLTMMSSPTIPDDTEEWNGTAWTFYLTALSHRDDAVELGRFCIELDKRFGCETSRNAEIRTAWLELALAAGVELRLADLTDFLRETGRMKYLRPIYSRLMKDSSMAGWARNVFDSVKGGYHPIARHVIGKLIAASEPDPVNA